MKPFKFPRWMIVLMLANLAFVIAAIEQARSVSTSFSPRAVEPLTSWQMIPNLLLFAVSLAGFLGVIGYVTLWVLRRSGLLRL